MNENTPASQEFDRRSFLRTGAATAAAAATAGVLTPLRGAGVDPDQKLKVGFIGTGGRGSGAAIQALSADDNVELYAMADVFEETINQSLENLSKNPAAEGKISVPPERRFVGLDGYKRVIDSGVDVVLLTTTPAFRPLHMRAAVEAGKHIFAEKPMAVDSWGYRHAMETLEMAKDQAISIVGGFCWRYSESRRAAYQKVLEEGLIGEITSIYATYYAGHSKPHQELAARTDGMSDIEWQLRNWYNYNWLSGGGYVEQACHSVDKVGWAMQDANPIACRAVGGLAAPQAAGDIFDHYHVAYEYPNNVWCHVASRKAPGCFNENADFVRGTEGTLVIGRGPAPYIEDNKGEVIWQYRNRSEPNMYQIEHDELFASIRSGEHINDGSWMMHSSLMGIMGRMSAHTGREVTWDEAVNSEEELFPNLADLQWDQSFDTGGVRVPGVSEIPGVS